MNEKKFHQDEFAMLLGNQINARQTDTNKLMLDFQCVAVVFQTSNIKF